MLRQYASAAPFDPERLAVGLSAARRRSRALARRLGLQHADEQDACQTILLDLVVRARRFDERRAPWPAFVAMTSRHAAMGVAQHVRRERAIHFQGGCEDALPALETSAPELAFDLARALRTLPDDSRRLVDLLLASDGVASAQRQSPMSAAAFYRRLKDLRARLRHDCLQS